MNPSTLKALEQSIEHWERLANGKFADNETPTADHCALCKLFFENREEEDRCKGCPVYNRTGFTSCFETPYGDAYNAFDDYGLDSESFKDAAHKELAFLKTLLPKDQQEK